jgi:AcrR family transcriptional regulator
MGPVSAAEAPSGDGATFSPANADRAAAPRGSMTGAAARHELRSRRHRAILEVALDILTTDGHEAMTMHRIAERLECGVASIYRLFPSKDALLAELQHDALRVLAASWAEGARNLDETLAAAGTDGQQAALTRALATGWFWIAAEHRFSYEIDLSRRVVVDRSTVVPPDQADRVLGATLELLTRGQRTFDAAVEAGALRPGNTVERAIVIVSTIFGVTLTAKFSRWDLELFDGERVASEALCDLFLAWGADPDAMERAVTVIRAEVEAGRLAPPVEIQPVRPT